MAVWIAIFSGSTPDLVREVIKLASLVKISVQVCDDRNAINLGHHPYIYNSYKCTNFDWFSTYSTGLHFHVVGEGVVRLRSQRQERVYDRENYIDFRMRLLGEPGESYNKQSQNLKCFLHWCVWLGKEMDSETTPTSEMQIWDKLTISRTNKGWKRFHRELTHNPGPKYMI
jgi:hypothetical protein